MTRAALGLLLLLTCALPARGDDYALKLLQDWIEAVQTHVPGVPDEALAAIADWNRDDLILMQPFVRLLVGYSTTDANRRLQSRNRVSNTDAIAVRSMSTMAMQGPRFSDFVKRAALLHTDAVLIAEYHPELIRTLKPRLRSRRDRSLATPLVIARGPDGRFGGFELGNLNWDYARDLLDAVTPSPAADETVALWYRAVSATHASAYNFGEAWPHLQRARRLLPDNAGILYGDGAMQETLASTRIQDYVRTTTLPNGGTFLFVESTRKHLEKADELLTRALQKDPNFVEARLRLGRVRGQLGRHPEALTDLRAVLAARPDPVVTFYAHLLVGDTHRALTQYEEARQSYQRALDLFPHAQSARMALSHLARLRSDREGALALLEPTLTKPFLGRDQDDPWWDYHRGDGRLVDDLLRRLREPFLTKAPQ